jgi:hypothetical protein
MFFELESGSKFIQPRVFTTKLEKIAVERNANLLDQEKQSMSSQTPQPYEKRFKPLDLQSFQKLHFLIFIILVFLDPDSDP